MQLSSSTIDRATIRPIGWSQAGHTRLFWMGSYADSDPRFCRDWNFGTLILPRFAISLESFEPLSGQAEYTRRVRHRAAHRILYFGCAYNTIVAGLHLG